MLIAATKKMAEVIVQRWFLAGEKHVAKTTLKLPQVRANIWLCTPETLKKVVPPDSSRVAGLLLVDMLCQVHKARGFDNGAFHIRNDRPQILNKLQEQPMRQWVVPTFVRANAETRQVGLDRHGCTILLS